MQEHAEEINVKNTFLEIGSKEAGLQPARRNQTCPSDLKPLAADNAPVAAEYPDGDLRAQADIKEEDVPEVIVKNTFLEIGTRNSELEPARRNRTCPSDLKPSDDASHVAKLDCVDCGKETTRAGARGQSPMSRFYDGPETPELNAQQSFNVPPMSMSEDQVNYAMVVPIACQPWTTCWFPDMSAMPSAFVAVPAPNMKSEDDVVKRPSLRQTRLNEEVCSLEMQEWCHDGVFPNPSEQPAMSFMGTNRRTRKDVRRALVSAGVGDGDPCSEFSPPLKERSRGRRDREIWALDGTGIMAGTELVCSQESFILESARSRKVVSKVMVGSTVTVAGPPQEVDFHNIVVPVKPRGVVKLKHFHKVPRAPSAGPSAVWVDLSHLKPKRLPGAHGQRLDKKPGGPA